MKASKNSPFKRLAAAVVTVALTMGLSPAAAWASTVEAQAVTPGSFTLPTDTTASSPVDVYMTISNKGELALAYQKITVSDLDSDGKITFDEALQVAHEKCCPAGKDGYAAPGGWVTKLWGVETQNASFAQNDKITSTVNATEIAAGDNLVASVHKDDVNYSDHYAFFDKKTATVKTGQALELTLKAINVMAYPPTDAVVAAGVQVGTWDNGFKALSGKKTDANGKVTLKFTKPGTYVVTASGTIASTSWSGAAVEAPLTAPFCVVTVKDKAKNTMTVSASTKTVKSSAIKSKGKVVSPLKVKKAKGTKSFKVTKWITKNSKKYFKVNTKNGKVTVKKKTPTGTYKFKVKVTAAGNNNYKAKSVTKKVTVKVVNK